MKVNKQRPKEGVPDPNLYLCEEMSPWAPQWTVLVGKKALCLPIAVFFNLFELTAHFASKKVWRHTKN